MLSMMMVLMGLTGCSNPTGGDDDEGTLEFPSEWTPRYSEGGKYYYGYFKSDSFNLELDFGKINVNYLENDIIIFSAKLVSITGKKMKIEITNKYGSSYSVGDQITLCVDYNWNSTTGILNIIGSQIPNIMDTTNWQLQ